MEDTRKTLGEILKGLRKEKGFTQVQLAKDFKVSKGAIAMWELNQRQPDNGTLLKLAEYFNVSIDYLLGRTDSSSTKIHPSNEFPFDGFLKMPIIGTISAGFDGKAVEEILGETNILPMSLHGYPFDECFLLKVKGDSMYPDFHDKDIVLVHRQSSVDSGTVAVIMYNGDDATLKKVVYKPNENWIDLVPRNPEYKTKRIENSDLQDCYVLGKAVTLVYREI